MIQFEETLSYDDVLLVPGYADFLPGGAKVQTQLTKKIRLNVPILRLPWTRCPRTGWPLRWPSRAAQRSSIGT